MRGGTAVTWARLVLGGESCVAAVKVSAFTRCGFGAGVCGGGASGASRQCPSGREAARTDGGGPVTTLPPPRLLRLRLETTLLVETTLPRLGTGWLALNERSWRCGACSKDRLARF